MDKAGLVFPSALFFSITVASAIFVSFPNTVCGFLTWLSHSRPAESLPVGPWPLSPPPGSPLGRGSLLSSQVSLQLGFSHLTRQMTPAPPLCLYASMHAFPSDWNVLCSVLLSLLLLCLFNIYSSTWPTPNIFFPASSSKVLY